MITALTPHNAHQTVQSMKALGLISDRMSAPDEQRMKSRLIMRRARAEKRGEDVSQYPPRVRKPKRTKAEKREERRKSGNHCPRCGRKWRKI